MRFLLSALLLCAACVVPSSLPGVAAGPAVITLAGNLDFLSPTRAWVEISSSAAYGDYCYRAATPPPSCSRATTGIYVTRDGGRTWRATLRFSGAPLTDSGILPAAWMRVFDIRHALVISTGEQVPGGRRDVLYRTANGGTSWRALPLPSGQGFITSSDISFVDWRDGWLLVHVDAAMGSEEVHIYRTRDAGGHWTLIACTTLPAGAAAPACRVPCGCRSGIPVSGHKDGIVFSRPSLGFLVNNNNAGMPFLHATHDGGLHWRMERPLVQGLPSRPNAAGLSPYTEFMLPMFSGSAGVLPATAMVCRTTNVCGTRSYVLLSHNAGQTWPVTRPLPFTFRASLAHWQVLTPTRWYTLVGGAIWTTADAGGRWTAIHPALPRGYTSAAVRFVTPATGWIIAARLRSADAGAQSTLLLRTDDGGAHWRTVSLPPSA